MTIKRMFRKKRTFTGERLYVENVGATASQALIDERDDPDTALPWIQIRLSRGPYSRSDYEEIEIMLPLKKASKLTQQLLNAVQAATPSVPRSAKAIPWGE